MSMNAERARSAFAESAGEINNQLANYNQDVENIKAQNKNLKNTFKTAKEMTAIRDVASEAGVRALKEFGGKYLKGAYEFKIPKLGKSVADLDREAGSFIEDRVPSVQYAREGLENLQGQAREGVEQLGRSVRSSVREGIGNIRNAWTRQRNIRRFGQADPEAETEMTDLGSENAGPYQGAGETSTMGPSDPVDYSIVDDDGQTNMGQEQMEDPDNMMGEAEDTAVEGPGETFEEFLNRFSTPKTSTGDIDFTRADDQLGMGQEDMRSRQLSNQANQEASERDQMGTEDRNVAQEPQAEEQAEEQVEMPWDGEGEVTEGHENLNENVREANSEAINDDVQTTTRNQADARAEDDDLGRGEAEEGAEDLAEDAGEEGGELATEEGAVGGLEGVGTALDATGIFSPLGALFNLAGLALEGFTAVEATKGVYDWVKDDVLGHGENAPQVAIPHPQKTLAQQGLMVIPTTDSIDTQQTVMGW